MGFVLLEIRYDFLLGRFLNAGYNDFLSHGKISEKVILLGWCLVIKVLDRFKVTTYGAAASDGSCSFFVLKMP